MRIVFCGRHYAVVAKLFGNQFKIGSCFKHIRGVCVAERVEGAETKVIFAPGVKVS